MPDKTADLEAMPLTRGRHRTREEGVCLTELAAWHAGEEHSDHPVSVSPILGVVARWVNDLLPDAERQALKPLSRKLPGTVSDGLDSERLRICQEWTINAAAPLALNVAAAALNVAGLTGNARECWHYSAACRYASWKDRKTAVCAMTAAEKATRDAARAASGHGSGDAIRAALAAAAAARAASGAAQAAAEVRTLLPGSAFPDVQAVARSHYGAQAALAAAAAAECACLSLGETTREALYRAVVSLLENLISPEVKEKKNA